MLKKVKMKKKMAGSADQPLRQHQAVTLEYVFRKAARDLYGVDLSGKDLEYKTAIWTMGYAREVELKLTAK